MSLASAFAAVWTMCGNCLLWIKIRLDFFLRRQRPDKEQTRTFEQREKDSQQPYEITRTAKSRRTRQNARVPEANRAPHVWRVLQDLMRLVHSMPELSEFPVRMISFYFCSWHVKQPEMSELPLQHNSLQHNWSCKRLSVLKLFGIFTPSQETVMRCLFLLFVSGSATSRNRLATSHAQILTHDSVSALWKKWFQAIAFKILKLEVVNVIVDACTCLCDHTMVF